MDYTQQLESDIIEWDIKTWKQALVFWDKILGQNLQKQRALEIGARNGGLSLYLGLKGCSVICSDIKGPSPLAKEKHVKYGIKEFVSYLALDGTRMPFPDNFFDIIAFKSLLGGIGRNNAKYLQERAMYEIYRVLKPKGILLFAENLVGSFFHFYFRKYFIKWASYWRYITIDEMQFFTSSFKGVHYETKGFFATFGRTERLRQWLYYIDRLVDPYISRINKYLIYGYAQK